MCVRNDDEFPQLISATFSSARRAVRRSHAHRAAAAASSYSERPLWPVSASTRRNFETLPERDFSPSDVSAAMLSAHSFALIEFRSFGAAIIRNQIL